jgi:23S rRNA (guanosine2251-2'-O)-methyltransferase
MRSIVIVAHNIRSTHNVGSLLRTAEGLGVAKVYLTGYTPYPIVPGDSRLPHISAKLFDQIQKTALNAQDSIEWEYSEDVLGVISKLKMDGYTLCALEQTSTAIPLPRYQPTDKVALILGSEVTGVDQSLLDICDTHLVIPMYGKKESFNVVQAAAMAIYQLVFHSNI